MDMAQPPQPQTPAEDPAALLKQARDLIDKALAAMGGEPQPEEDGMEVEQAFGQGFNGADQKKSGY